MGSAGVESVASGLLSIHAPNELYPRTEWLADRFPFYWQICPSYYTMNHLSVLLLVLGMLPSPPLWWINNCQLTALFFKGNFWSSEEGSVDWGWFPCFISFRYKKLNDIIFVVVNPSFCSVAVVLLKTTRVLGMVLGIQSSNRERAVYEKAQWRDWFNLCIFLWLTVSVDDLLCLCFGQRATGVEYNSSVVQFP